MNIQSKYRTRTTGDGKIIRICQEIAQELNQDAVISISFLKQDSSYGFTDAPPFDLSDISNQPVVLHALEHPDALWAKIHVSFTSTNISFQVNRHSNGARKLNGGLRTSDDEITISYNQHRDPIESKDLLSASRAFSLIQKHFVPYNHAAAIEQAIGPELAEFYNLREEGLSRLENLTERIVRETHDYRLKLDREFAEHKKASDEYFAKKEKTLEEEHNERINELNTQEGHLEKLRQELDDRTARHARREQSRNLQSKIATRSEKFTLTPDTQRKRWPIHAIFVVLLLMSGGLIARSLFVPPMTTEGIASWLEFGRLPLGVLGFALTAIYYIRWNDHWFSQHADQEFRLQQLALDVDRAGYATEMLLEWQEDKGGEMPEVLVDRLTTGLFTDQTKSGHIQHPAEDITDILIKAASNVGVNIPGIDVTLPGRKLRKLAKSQAK